MDVFQLIRRHESERLKPYCDKCGEDLVLRTHGWGCACTAALKPPGNITIGVGRNLSGVGIRLPESQGMLADDVGNRLVHLRGFNWYSRLDVVRQAVVIDMAFCLGVGGFDAFHLFQAAMANADYAAAAQQLRSSDWHAKKPKRPEELARMLETGEWPQGPY